MVRLRPFAALIACVLLAGFSHAAGLPLGTATGIVVSANSSVLIVRPRNSEGQFGPALTLKVRGTSKITTLTTRKTGGKVVPVQNDADVSAARKNQVIAVIYTTMDGDRVLLSAVVQPASR